MTVGFKILINITSLIATAVIVWLCLPSSNEALPVHAFGLPDCQLFQGKRLAETPSLNPVCGDCGDEILNLHKKCNKTQADWECAFDPGLNVQCTDTCFVAIPDRERMCRCRPPVHGCPAGQQWDITRCACVVPPEPSCALFSREPSLFRGLPSDPCLPMSPILVSLRGNRLELTGLAGGVDFDLDADGFPERVGWTQAESDDAFLAMDRDGNGTIDDGSELFGSFTPQPPSDSPNGFRALAVFDDPARGGNADGRISAADSVFRLLRFWTDANHDGIAQLEEVEPVTSTRAVAFLLQYRESRRTDRHGNQFRWIGRVEMDPASRGPRRKAAIDVIFVSAR